MNDTSDSMLRGLRHDLRTPINHIIGYSELLLEEAESEGREVFIPDLQRIHAAGRTLLALVNDLLDGEKVAAGGVDAALLSRELRTPLTTIVGYSELLQEEAADRGDESLLPDLAKIHAAGARLLELVDVALGFSKLRGDTAPNGAAGLGAPAPGLSLAAGTEMPPVERRAVPPAHGSLLVVDDDAMNRDLLSRRLERLGYHVAVAEHGRQALELLAAQPFDVLLLDIMMPVMDGFQVLAHLKADPVLRELPVIVLSAGDEVEDAVACIEMGADDYLAKPVNAVLLLARIGACLEKKRLRDREVAYLQQAAQVTGPAALAQLLCAKFDFAIGAMSEVPVAGEGRGAPVERLLADVERESEWVDLRKGDVLCRRGDPSDSVYVVLYGRLRVLVADSTGREQPARDLGRGDTVGELGLVTGRPRSATVYALRDSGLIRISKSGFDRLAAQHPRELTRTTGDVIGKLRQAFLPPHLGRPVTAVALVPLGADVPLPDLAHALAAALAAHGPVLHLDRERLGTTLGEDAAQTLEQDTGGDRLAAWLNDLELQHRFVLYQADPVFSPWTRRCIRQADRILLVGRAESPPLLAPIEAEIERAEAGRPAAHRELALLHRDREAAPTGTREWLQPRSVATHHHVCLQSRADVDRLARRLAGRGVGLVLGGGGMRGAAHIGVLRALREAGIPVDLVGGTSVGAMMAGQHAMGWDYQTMQARTHALIVAGKALADYTLPIASLIAGQRYRTALLEMFGDTRIEDLWLPYFCIASNLTRADLVIRRDGLLRRAVRASSSLPGVFPPVLEQQDLLVDGGLLNNLPADVMSTFCDGGPVIAVDLRANVDLSRNYAFGESVSAADLLWSRLNPRGKEKIRAPGILDVLVRSALLGSVYAGASQLPPHTLYINPPVSRFGLLDGSATEAMIDIGYQHARDCIEQWLERGDLTPVLAGS